MDTNLETKNYLAFMRSQRAVSLRELKSTMNEVAERRIVETTKIEVICRYNSDDVSDILGDVARNCEATFQAELMLHSHMNFLLIQQYVNQALKKGFQLGANFSELENRKLLAEAAELENRLFAGGTVPVALSSASTLQLSHETELQQKIDDEKNIKIPKMDYETCTVLKSDPDLQISSLMRRIRSLEKDLENRVDKSTPVQNLKKMLMQKNEVLKEYREKLSM
ncbi:Leucine zipper transcription factor-like protein 1 [Entophlyctis sp. JEL0112]|nr:Leucine zipper transcription factor-like protein 1 [Entophlyctis sp. JEL0112]